jgi:hypothetical protein
MQWCQNLARILRYPFINDRNTHHSCLSSMRGCASSWLCLQPWPSMTWAGAWCQMPQRWLPSPHSTAPVAMVCVCACVCVHAHVRMDFGYSPDRQTTRAGAYGVRSYEANRLNQITQHLRWVGGKEIRSASCDAGGVGEDMCRSGVGEDICRWSRTL